MGWATYGSHPARGEGERMNELVFLMGRNRRQVCRLCGVRVGSEFGWFDEV